MIDAGNYPQVPIAPQQILRQINDNIPDRFERLPVDHKIGAMLVGWVWYFTLFLK